jgi:hypothetical protein
VRKRRERREVDVALRIKETLEVPARRSTSVEQEAPRHLICAPARTRPWRSSPARSSAGPAGPVPLRALIHHPRRPPQRGRRRAARRAPRRAQPGPRRPPRRRAHSPWRGLRPNSGECSGDAAPACTRDLVRRRAVGAGADQRTRRCRRLDVPRRVGDGPWATPAPARRAAGRVDRRRTRRREDERAALGACAQINQ